MQSSRRFIMLALALLAGCDLSPDLGDLCLFGTPADFDDDYAGLVGAEEQAKLAGLCSAAESCTHVSLAPGLHQKVLVVRAEEGADIELRSSAPDVLSVDPRVHATAPCETKDDEPVVEGLVDLEAVAAGEVELSVLVDGREVDRFSLSVGLPTKLAISASGEVIAPEDFPELAPLPEGFYLGPELAGVLTDHADNPLLTSEPIAWQIDDVAVAELASYTGTEYVYGDEYTTTSTVWLETRAEGETTLHARWQELEATLPIHVREP
jgi:hypothetical protein